MSIAVNGRVDLTQSAVAKTNRGTLRGMSTAELSDSERWQKLTGRRDGEHFIVQRGGGGGGGGQVSPAI